MSIFQRTPIAEISASDAMKMLCSRWEQRGSVREAFLQINQNSDGAISPSELLSTVTSLGVSISGPEFRKLWRMFDTSGEGRLTHAAFSRIVGPLIFPSSWGFSATMCVFFFALFAAFLDTALLGGAVSFISIVPFPLTHSPPPLDPTLMCNSKTTAQKPSHYAPPVSQRRDHSGCNFSQQGH